MGKKVVDENSKYGFIKSILGFSISSWINFFIGVSSTIILTRVFTPEVYGTVNIFNTTSSALMSIICFGLDSAYMRYFNEPPEKNDRRQLAYKLINISLFGSILLGVVINVFFYVPFNNILFGQTSWFLSVMLFVSAISSMLLKFFNITYRMTFNIKQFMIQSILTQVVTKLFVVVAALFNPTPNIVITFNVIGVFLLVIIYTFLQKDDLFPNEINFNLRGFGELFKYAAYSAPIYIVINLNAFFSQIILKSMINMTAVGIFAAVNAFVAILTVLKGGFGTYWSAFMFQNYKTHNERILQVHDYIMFFSFLAFWGIITFKDIIYLMIGPQYHESKDFFALVLSYSVLGIITETTTYGLSIKKRVDITLINYIVSVITNLMLGYFLTKYYGIMGIAVATCISGVVLYVLNTIGGQKYYRSIRSYKKSAIGTIMILIIAIVPSLINLNKLLYPVLFLLIFIEFIIYRTEVKKVLDISRDMYTSNIKSRQK